MPGYNSRPDGKRGLANSVPPAVNCAPVGNSKLVASRAPAATQTPMAKCTPEANRRPENSSTPTASSRSPARWTAGPGSRTDCSSKTAVSGEPATYGAPVVSNSALKRRRTTTGTGKKLARKKLRTTAGRLGAVGSSRPAESGGLEWAGRKQ